MRRAAGARVQGKSQRRAVGVDELRAGSLMRPHVAPLVVPRPVAVALVALVHLDRGECSPSPAVHCDRARVRVGLVVQVCSADDGEDDPRSREHHYGAGRGLARRIALEMSFGVGDVLAADERRHPPQDVHGAAAAVGAEGLHEGGPALAAFIVHTRTVSPTSDRSGEVTGWNRRPAPQLSRALGLNAQVLGQVCGVPGVPVGIVLGRARPRCPVRRSRLAASPVPHNGTRRLLVQLNAGPASPPCVEQNEAGVPCCGNLQAKCLFACRFSTDL